jgi:hypothetical protein
MHSSAVLKGDRGLERIFKLLEKDRREEEKDRPKRR